LQTTSPDASLPAVKLVLRRVILFTRSLETLTTFYRDTLGLALVGDERGWKDFDAGGGVRLSLHSGEPAVGKTKLAFFTADVEKTRAELLERGVKMKRLIRGEGLDLCDGEDPDGNVFQLSNRA